MNPYLSDEKRKSFIKLEIDLNSGNNIQGEFSLGCITLGVVVY